MKEIKGNIWDFHDQKKWIVITTNGNVKSNGEVVMGKGIALEAKQRFPELPRRLGKMLLAEGSKVYPHFSLRLISFPTKRHWRDKSSPILIEASCKELVELVNNAPLIHTNSPVYMPRPGCGNGGLNWKDVRPILEKYLDDRFIVVERLD